MLSTIWTQISFGNSKYRFKHFQRLTPKVPNVDIFSLPLILSHIYSLAFCNLLTISEGSGLHQVTHLILISQLH